MLILKIITINLLFIASFILLLPQHPWPFVFNTFGVFYLIVIQLQRNNKQQHKTLHALFDGLQSLQDGDFAISLTESSHQKNNVEQHQLITLFNEVTDKLREEKQSLYHRELLLDKVVNASDVVTVLVNQRNTIIFANRAAQHFFESSALLGHQWSELLAQRMPELLQHHDKNNAIIQLQIKEKITGLVHQNKVGI